MTDIVVKATCNLHNFLMVPSDKTVLQVESDDVNVQIVGLVIVYNMHRVHAANTTCEVKLFYRFLHNRGRDVNSAE